MPYIPIRKKIAEQKLNGVLIHKLMTKLFPKRNDYGTASFDELVPELARFGIDTVRSFQRLMKGHRRELLVIDRDRLEPWEIQHYSDSFGKDWVLDAFRRRYWFAYSVLVRMAAELEFGEAAVACEDAS